MLLKCRCDDEQWLSSLVVDTREISTSESRWGIPSPSRGPGVTSRVRATCRCEKNNARTLSRNEQDLDAGYAVPSADWRAIVDMVKLCWYRDTIKLAFCCVSNGRCPCSVSVIGVDCSSLTFASWKPSGVGADNASGVNAYRRRAMWTRLTIIHDRTHCPLVLTATDERSPED